ncbi:MAG: hypothetical protein HYV07_25285 [Deltaproteobacteria bacterium]|nr:hypothetical protein [Deltaproteobacteria bacterium]
MRSRLEILFALVFGAACDPESPCRETDRRVEAPIEPAPPGLLGAPVRLSRSSEGAVSIYSRPGARTSTTYIDRFSPEARWTSSKVVIAPTSTGGVPLLGVQTIVAGDRLLMLGTPAPRSGDPAPAPAVLRLRIIPFDGEPRELEIPETRCRACALSWSVLRHESRTLLVFSRLLTDVRSPVSLASIGDEGELELEAVIPGIEASPNSSLELLQSNERVLVRSGRELVLLSDDLSTFSTPIELPAGTQAIDLSDDLVVAWTARGPAAQNDVILEILGTDGHTSVPADRITVGFRVDDLTRSGNLLGVAIQDRAGSFLAVRERDGAKVGGDVPLIQATDPSSDLVFLAPRGLLMGLTRSRFAYLVPGPDGFTRVEVSCAP